MPEQIRTSNMLRKGTILHGVYRIDDYLSSGGFGNTYVATNVEFEETVAIKEFFMRGVTQRDANNTTVSVSNSENIQQFEEQREKFKKEARRLRKLKNEHIVRVHDLFEENGTAYYVMDYIDGESLAERLKRTDKSFSEAEVKKLLPQLLDALKEVHQNKIWHLDLKPGNVMLDNNGKVYLIDFGASKQIRANGGITTSTALCYTPGYAPNEQIGQMYDRFGPWTDIYALGATIYTLLTNKKSPVAIDIEEEGEDAYIFPTDVSDEMRKIVIWMMQPKRKARPQTVDEIEERLKAAKIGNKMPKTVDKKDGEGTIIINSPIPISSSSSEPMIETKGIETTVKVSLASINHPNPIIQNLINNMVLVEGGVFMMGSTEEQNNNTNSDEKPAHYVSLSSFFIGRYEVTQEEWEAVMGNNPSNFKGVKKPVENISWNDCKTFIRKLNAITGLGFRLPTEAEWEYAARGGNSSLGYIFPGANDIGSVAWYDSNSGDQTHNVGTKLPNELGLYDMAGNVWEWCSDWHGKYSSSSQTNPKGVASGSCHVYRGGGWRNLDGCCRVSYRCFSTSGYRNYDLGLRLAL